MDSDFVGVFTTLMAIMIPVAVGGGIFVLIASFAKRRGGRNRSIRPASGSDDLTRVLESVERLDLRMQQLEERLDFVERVLPPLREGKPLVDAPDPSSPS